MATMATCSVSFSHSVDYGLGLWLHVSVSVSHPEAFDNDCCFMFRLGLAITQTIDRDLDTCFGYCYPFRSLLIATVITCFG